MLKTVSTAVVLTGVRKQPEAIRSRSAGFEVDTSGSTVLLRNKVTPRGPWISPCPGWCLC